MWVAVEIESGNRQWWEKLIYPWWKADQWGSLLLKGEEKKELGTEKDIVTEGETGGQEKEERIQTREEKEERR